MPTRLLAQEGHEITVFYANSNIAPAAEYERRLGELRKYGAAQGFPVIEGNYDPLAWEREVAPIGEAIKRYSPAFGRAFAVRHVDGVGHVVAEAAGAGTGTGDGDGAIAEGSSAEEGFEVAGKGDGEDSSIAEVSDGGGALQAASAPPATVAELLDDERRKERCRACYRMRLEEAAAQAAKGGFEGLATTLAVSPYQFTDVIREELERACSKAGIAFCFEDYRPYYDEATRTSRELGMYRQNYCGCRFSVQEGEATRAFVKEQRKAKKAARQAEREKQDAERRRHAQEKQAYAQAQARKRAILKQMRSASHEE